MSSREKINRFRKTLKLRRMHYQQAAMEDLTPSGSNHEGEEPGAHHHHHHHAHHGPALAEAEKTIEKLREQLLRNQAEFENTRRRLQRDQQQQLEFANQKLLEVLVPVLDNMDRALSNPGDSIEGLLNGLQMVRRQFGDVLAQNGLEKIEALGQPFDPNRHEAVSTAPAEGVPENQVVEVFQDGYQLKGRLIRPAMVKVAR